MSKKKRLEKAVPEATGSIEQKRDNSPYVYQGEKISFDLTIREFPWTEEQKAFIEIGLNKTTNYILCEAPPGVGKTLMAVYIGLRLLQARKISNIYFVRSPIESASKGLGYLAGDLTTKMSPYEGPMNDHLNELLPPSQYNRLVKEGFIQSIPMGFLKGRTFNASLIIVDEAEDLSVQEVLMAMGRLGRFSRMILIGNKDQSYIKNSGFERVYDLFNDSVSQELGIYCLPFDASDIKRNDILAYVITRFKAIT